MDAITNNSGANAMAVVGGAYLASRSGIDVLALAGTYIGFKVGVAAGLLCYAGKALICAGGGENADSRKLGKWALWSVPVCTISGALIGKSITLISGPAVSATMAVARFLYTK